MKFLGQPPHLTQLQIDHCHDGRDDDHDHNYDHDHDDDQDHDNHLVYFVQLLFLITTFLSCHFKLVLNLISVTTQVLGNNNSSNRIYRARTCLRHTVYLISNLNRWSAYTSRTIATLSSSRRISTAPAVRSIQWIFRNTKIWLHSRPGGIEVSPPTEIFISSATWTKPHAGVIQDHVSFKCFVFVGWTCFIIRALNHILVWSKITWVLNVLFLFVELVLSFGRLRCTLENKTSSAEIII